jgi:uncharacterized protein HemX
MANEKKQKTVVNEVKEETTNTVVGEVVNNNTNEKKISTKSTWLNRIWSAIVGAIIAVGSMFGITSEQISAQKAKVESIQTQTKEALDALKSGDPATAITKLTEVTADVTNTTKNVISDVKEVSTSIKESDKTQVAVTAIKGAAEALVKNETKKIEAATKQYSN